MLDNCLRLQFKCLPVQRQDFCRTQFNRLSCGFQIAYKWRVFSPKIQRNRAMHGHELASRPPELRKARVAILDRRIIQAWNARTERLEERIEELRCVWFFFATIFSRRVLRCGRTLNSSTELLYSRRSVLSSRLLSRAVAQSEAVGIVLLCSVARTLHEKTTVLRDKSGVVSEI